MPYETAMPYDRETLNLAAEQLAADGRATIGHLTAIAEIEPDADSSVYDDECYGALEWTRDSSYGASRPDACTGRARIVDRDRVSTLWWEPPVDGTDEQVSKLETAVCKLLAYGYHLLIVRLYEQVIDSYGAEHRVEVGSRCLGGIDSYEYARSDEAVRDVLHEAVASLPAAVKVEQSSEVEREQVVR